MSRLVYGVGLNDKGVPVFKQGIKVKEYALWQSILQRCYAQKRGLRNNNYSDCCVSENFKSYSFFYDWCQTQIGFGTVDSDGRAWCLDKDILFKRNRVYSEDNCVFVPQEINALLLRKQKNRGVYPIGVSLHKQRQRYTASCGINGKVTHIGIYDTPYEAFLSYKSAKEQQIQTVAEKHKEELDYRAYKALLEYQIEITD